MEKIKIALITLLDLKGFGNKTVKKFYDFSNKNLDTPEEIYLELIKFNKKITKEEIFNAWNKALEIINISNENEIEIVTYLDKKYPHLLKQIDNFPLILYLKGNLDLLNKKAIAVIGSRNHSNKAKELCEIYTKHLVENDFVIVSGLAKGIDSIAHETTLKEKGKTIAILATGLDTIYPKENFSLSRKIIENDGLLITEYPFNYKFNKFSFVQRDRLQSGISLGTLVIETSVKGGSMQTSNFTLKQNRKLLVIKYDNITELNNGNFKLIENNNNSFPIYSVDKLNNYLINMNNKKDLNNFF